jgi:hypothetical protein
MSAIGSDFQRVKQTHRTRCSECGAGIPVGEIALESIRDGKCRKRVCSNQCRIDFDDRYWQERAALRKRNA